MTESRQHAAEPDWQALHNNAARLVDNLDLVEIRTLRAEVELLDAAVADALDFTAPVTDLQVQSMRPSPDNLVFRFRHEDVFTDTDGNDGARILLEFGIAFECAEDMDDPSQEEVESFAVTTVLRIQQPYYREGVSSLLNRIGVGNMTVGLVRIPLPEVAPDPEPEPSPK